MTKISSLATATAVASFLLMGGAFAQTAAPAAKDAAPAAAAGLVCRPVADTAESIECSKEADAKGLHGKERKKFRSECKKEKSGGAAAAPAGTK